MKHDRQEAVLNLLRNFRGSKPLKELFWSELNYQRVNEPLSRRGWTATAASALAEDPLLFAAGGANSDFHVIYARLNSEKPQLGPERPVVTRLLSEHPYGLFIFSNADQDMWHFVNVKYDEKITKRRLFRRMTIGREERLRTASERVALLDLSSISAELFGISPLAIQQRHDEAFDVEAVTKQFFNEYNAAFSMLQSDLEKQTKDRTWAHDYALQFLNRLMFLYFIQRKRWLGEDNEFLSTFWKTYQASGQSRDTFFDCWLKVLFFEAFNNKFHGGHRQFPDSIKQGLSLAPYLNGGLFAENELDHKRNFIITDNRFSQLFAFLERYNFTIAEDSPLDQEVAVDPEMIGKVYESLVNVSTEADERGDAGIFYTPRTEIDLMCRLALVDNLSSHLGQEHKNHLYEIVIALELEEKRAADRVLAADKLWPALNNRLREITVLDPACGSGSFLVGMLNILDDLQARAAEKLGITETAYDRKKRIIGQSLYGVDVMDWACHVAELRLWLSLIIDAQFTKADLKMREEPLLPHFTFKIRCGDSLVQEIGGINMGHFKGVRTIDAKLKARITKLKNEKLKFYNNEHGRLFHSETQLKQEELGLFRSILDTRMKTIQDDIKVMRRKIDGPGQPQIRLDGTVETQSHQIELNAIEDQKIIEQLNAELKQLEQARLALNTIKKEGIPFVWDIAFVEIFQDGKYGFDIVIGNPPYVRQENISDPHLAREEVTTDNKKVYKSKLTRSVYDAFPRFFGYRSTTGKAAHKLDAKSDLYIFFYFHGLSLLNPKGTFCFITSNSWLDVGYGKDLQEFLLRHSHVKMIIDNQVKRSFASADVNTVIAVLSAPDERREIGLEKEARFVMLTAPFEHILSPVIFEEIDSARKRTVAPEYRVFPVQQRELLEKGWEWPEDTTEEEKKRYGRSFKGGKYGGNKWGGQYLRAPDIYWTILEKGQAKFVRLETVARVKFGIKTGANEFFYLDKAALSRWEIESEFLKPIVLSSRECSTINVQPSQLKYMAFTCHDTKKALKGTKALKYIEWGESQGFHKRPSCASRPLWYDLGVRKPGKVLWPMIHNDRPGAYLNEYDVLVDHNLFEIVTDYPDVVWASLFWIGQIIFRELYGRANLGEGALKTEGVDIKKLMVVRPDIISNDQIKIIQVAISKLSSRSINNVSEESGIRLNNGHVHSIQPMQDRAMIDDLIFDILELKQGEREAVYIAAYDLVTRRLTKSETFKRKEKSNGKVVR